MANNDELVAIIEGWIQCRERDEAALRMFEEAHVPVVPIISVKEAPWSIRT